MEKKLINLWWSWAICTTLIIVIGSIAYSLWYQKLPADIQYDLVVALIAGLIIGAGIVIMDSSLFTDSWLFASFVGLGIALVFGILGHPLTGLSFGSAYSITSFLTMLILKTKRIKKAPQTVAS